MFHRTLKLLSIQGSGATVLDSILLPDMQVSSLATSPDRIFIATSPYYSYYGSNSDAPDPAKLITLDGLHDGHLRIASTLALQQDMSWPRLIADATRALIVGSYPPVLHVYDTSNAAAPTETKKADLYSWAYDIRVVGDNAMCTLGEYGVQTVPLSN